MDWQQLVSLIIVGTTALAFVWANRRLRQRRGGCDSLCGCSPSGLTQPQGLIFHGRKGKRPRVVVKAR
jgi:hypothetical protein